jgi:hypothetical protein
MYFTNLNLPYHVLLNLLEIRDLLLVIIFSLLLYISWTFFARSISSQYKEIKPEEPTTVPSVPQLSSQSCPKNLSISNSLIAFSQIGPNGFRYYNHLAKIHGFPEFQHIMDSLLMAQLRQIGKLAWKLNDKLDELAVQGVNAMIIFVFEASAPQRKAIFLL